MVTTTVKAADDWPFVGRTQERESILRALDRRGPTDVALFGPPGAGKTVTVTNTSSGGFVSVFKNGIPTPITSTVNWGLASSTIANGAVTAVDANALFACYCPSQTDVIIDAIGYYR